MLNFILVLLQKSINIFERNNLGLTTDVIPLVALSGRILFSSGGIARLLDTANYFHITPDAT